VTLRARRASDAGAAAAESQVSAGGGPRRGRARRGRDPWRAAFFVALVLAVTGVAAWALLGPSVLVVRHEEVSGNRLVPAAEIVSAADVRLGTPLVSVDTAAAASRVEQIDQVLTATVTRSWPDAIVITVHERTPALAVPDGRGYALIDGHGVTVRWSARRPAGLPLLQSPPAQLRGNASVQAAALVLGQLPRRLRRLIVAVSASGPGALTFWLRGGASVMWGGPGQTAAKAAELTVLLRTGARYYDVSDPATAVTQG